MAVWTVVSRLLATLFAAAAFAGAAQAGPVAANHLEAELVAQGQAVPGGETYVALIQRLEPGWHSYWRNPGSAGEATQIAWTLPEGWSAGPIVWATPQHIPVGPLVSFAYEGEVVLPVAIHVPADAKPGTRVMLKGEALFLVCKEICVPADAGLTVELEVADTPRSDPKWALVIADALAAAPKPAGLKAALVRDGSATRLAVAGDGLDGATIKDAFFFPFEGDKIDPAGAQPGERGPHGLTLTLAPQPGAEIGALSGVLSVDGRGYEITAVEGPAPQGASGLGALKPAADHSGMSVPLAALFALVGGLILNLMPCVFPVLSMKGAQLAAHAHDPRTARLQGVAFLVGVLVTFLILAGTLLAARAAGSAAGWGFQLQSPAVTAGLAVLMLLVALNLFGVFEVGASAQGLGDGLARRDGIVGAGFTGALAVVVAAPCTAPFMAAALGYAVSRPPAEALSIFAALGLGFAAPFTALSFAPALLRRLPRPGPWMTTFRTVLAFPMLGASAWLAWVFAAQAGVTGLGALFLAALIVAFAAWLFGRGQRAFGRVVRIGLQICLPLALIIAGVILALTLHNAPPPPVAAAASGGAQAQVWSPEAVANARAEGRPVFVDFTAAWCVTCQVNERVALSGPGFAEALRLTGGVYMKADWTNRDETIAKALAEHGRAGVPLYLVYPAQGGAPKILPQLLTEGMVREALEAAARPAGPAGRG